MKKAMYIETNGMDIIVTIAEDGEIRMITEPDFEAGMALADVEDDSSWDVITQDELDYYLKDDGHDASIIREEAEIDI